MENKFEAIDKIEKESFVPFRITFPKGKMIVNDNVHIQFDAGRVLVFERNASSVNFDKKRMGIHFRNSRAEVGLYGFDRKELRLFAYEILKGTEE